MMFLINGQRSEFLPLSDRGLHYGDGLFETIAVRNGRLEFWPRHIQRLQRSCVRLRLPGPDSALLLSETKHLLGDRGDAVIKIIITRGSSGRGYLSPDTPSTSRIIACYPTPDTAVTDIARLRICDTRLGINPGLAGMKHLNRLEQVMARNEWTDKKITEGLMLSHNNFVIEGTMSNLFFIKDGQLLTPDLSNAGVAGIIREVVIKLAADNNIPVTISDFSLNDIQGADEVFITNSLLGIQDIQQLGNHTYSAEQMTSRIKTLFEQCRQQDSQHEII